MKRLKELRKEKKITQQEVADFLNIARVHYTNIENGKRGTGFETVVKLAQYFDVTTDYLLGNSDDPTPPNNDLIIPDILKDAKVAFYRGEFDELTQSEVDKLAEFAEFLKSKRDEDNKK